MPWKRRGARHHRPSGKSSWPCSHPVQRCAHRLRLKTSCTRCVSRSSTICLSRMRSAMSWVRLANFTSFVSATSGRFRLAKASEGPLAGLQPNGARARPRARRCRRRPCPGRRLRGRRSLSAGSPVPMVSNRSPGRSRLSTSTRSVAWTQRIGRSSARACSAEHEEPEGVRQGGVGHVRSPSYPGRRGRAL